MNHDAIYICASIFALLGIRLGWNARVVPLLGAICAAVATTALFVSIDEHVFKFIVVAALFDVAAQGGFVIGLITNEFGEKRGSL